MQKFKIEVSQTGYRNGIIEVEAPDMQAALALVAGNKRYDDPAIKYEDWQPSLVEYVEHEAVWVVD